MLLIYLVCLLFKVWYHVSSTWSKMTCFTALIMLVYSSHNWIIYSCAFVVAKIMATVKFPLGYTTVTPGLVGTGNAVLHDFVAYTLGCA